MRIYKKEVEIRGYGKFEKICTFDKKNGMFEIDYPVNVVSKNIVNISSVYANTLKAVEELWYKEVAAFEDLTYDYKTVILYKVEENGSYRDGSGQGFTFIYGVFRMINKGYKKEYVFERGPSNINEPYHYGFKEWNKITWTKEREDVFDKIGNSITDMFSKLQHFCESMEEYKVKDSKLLEEENEEQS